jgi:hypothetical protein
MRRADPLKVIGLDTTIALDARLLRLSFLR